ncbi:MAG: glycosyltransferase family 39 protein [Candidatus Sumerlaeia bacterium]
MLANWDTQLFLFLNNLHVSPLDWFFKFLTEFGNFKIPLIIGMVAVMWKGNARWRMGLLLLAVSIGCSDMIGAVLKNIVGRERPFWVLEQARLLVGKSSSGSFPSNHSANLFSGATLLSLYVGRRGVSIGLFILAFLVAYSRIYVGVHYPSDAIGGALLGMFCGGGVYWLHRKWPLLVRDHPGRWRAGWWGLLWLILVLATAYRLAFIANPNNTLFAEEAQYWDWSRHLALSYYSKPPLIAYINFIGTSLFGNTEFGVRIGALVAGLILAGVSILLVWRISESARVVFFTLFFMCFIPLFAVGSVIHTTDTPLALFWGLTLFSVYMAMFKNRPRFWYLAGLFFGLGMLSKYAIIYLPICVLLYMIITKTHRHWLKKPQPYLAILIGLVCFTPVIVWNWQNDFVAFRHVGGQVTTDEGFGLRFDDFFDFLGSQLGVVSPGVFVAMLYAAWAVLRRRELRTDCLFRFLLCTSLPVFGLLLFKSLLGEVEANWAAMAYYAWLIMTVIYFNRWYMELREKGRTRPVRVWLIVAMFFAVLGTALIHEPKPIRSELFRKIARSLGSDEPHKMDPHWRGAGWDRLGKSVSRMMRRMPNPDRTFIVATRYQDAALLGFYVEGHPEVYNVNYGRRKTQYDIWPGPKDKKGWDAIFVTLDDKKWEKYHRRMGDSFERSDAPEHVDVKFKDTVYHEYVVSRHYGFQGEFAHEKDFDSY